MGYKPITFILWSFSSLGSLAGRLEIPLKKRQHNAKHPDSALDSAGVETENEEVLTGAKKFGIKFTFSSLKLRWAAMLLSF